MKDDQDVEQLHGCLVEEYHRNRLSGDELSALQRMTGFIVRASVRIAQLRTEDDSSGVQEDEPPRPPDRRSAAGRDR